MKIVGTGCVVAMLLGLLFAGSALAGSEELKLQCQRGNKHLGDLLVKQSYSHKCTPSGSSLAEECNSKYPEDCEGSCWACRKYKGDFVACYKPDGTCEGGWCESTCKD